MSLYVDISKKYDGFTLDIQMDAANGITGLLGASGCGKSMTLQCISGIIRPDSGVIVLNGKTIFDSKRKINVPIRRRNVGDSFQHFSLFPHMTVEENIHFALRSRSKKQCTQEADDKIDMFGLEDFRKRYPGQLSGGQKQRVALARMLASSPEILMLDEPFSALDKHIRLSLENELMRALDAFPYTTLYVSHDMDEVYRICPQIAVIHDGRIEDQGHREDMLLVPQTLAGARISGCKNLSPARKTGEYTLLAEDWGISLYSEKPVPDDLKYVGIRARHLREIPADEASGSPNVFKALVDYQSETRFDNTIICRLTDAAAPQDARILWLFDKMYNTKPYKNGQTIHLHIPPESLHLLCR
jgi:molybdate transport system ATP-binding protein